MLNLLPQSAQTASRVEYYSRLSRVVLIAVLAAIAGSILLIFPSYVAIMAHHASLEKQKEIADSSKAGVTRDKLFSSLTTIQALFTRAATFERVTPPSASIDLLLSNRTHGITLSSFSYEKMSDSEAKIALEGTALSRSDLVEYVSTLKNISAFSNVDLPVSNLAGSANIPFSLELRVRITKE